MTFVLGELESSSFILVRLGSLFLINMSLTWIESVLVTKSELNGAQLVVDFELVTRRNAEYHQVFRQSFLTLSSSRLMIYGDRWKLILHDFSCLWILKKPCVPCDQMRFNVQLNDWGRKPLAQIDRVTLTARWSWPKENSTETFIILTSQCRFPGDIYHPSIDQHRNIHIVSSHIGNRWNICDPRRLSWFSFEVAFSETIFDWQRSNTVRVMSHYAFECFYNDCWWVHSASAFDNHEWSILSR